MKFVRVNGENISERKVAAGSKDQQDPNQMAGNARGRHSGRPFEAYFWTSNVQETLLIIRVLLRN